MKKKGFFNDWEPFGGLLKVPSSKDLLREVFGRLNQEAMVLKIITIMRESILTAAYVVLKKHRLKNLAKIIKEISDESNRNLPEIIEKQRRKT